MTSVTIPIEMLARLPPKLLRQIAEAAERREQAAAPGPDLSDCVKALFAQHRLPPAPPADSHQANTWRRAFVAAVSECWQRYTMGQQRAVKAGVPGALVPGAWKALPEVRVRARR